MNAKLSTVLGLAALLGACASTPKTYPALESARAAVQAAQADPNVARYSALDLQAAQNELQAADAAAQKHQDAMVAQPAYMAAQTARLAQARATAKADDARVAAGQAERDRIELEARNRQLQQSQAATQVAKADATAAAATAAAANQQSARLQSEIEQLKATPTDRGLVLTLGDVLFDTGKSELNSGATRKLDQLAQFLSEHKDRRVEIDGFTDSVGSDSYNQELSRRRADSVKMALLTRGIDPSRITTEGFGKAFPVASNNDSGGRQLNRRVEVVIGGDNGSPIAPRS
jgi:outer membrane protein OmpA-like peptidoglycan-associated protein